MDRDGPFESEPVAAESTVSLHDISINETMTYNRYNEGSVSDEDSIRLDEEPDRLDLPQLSLSMTPWRNRNSQLGTSLQANKESSATDSHLRSSRELSRAPFELASPSNSRPLTRNSLFSEDYLSSAPTASASSGNEAEQLQRQLTACRLRLRVLTEVLKELNYGRDTCSEDGSSRKLLYEKLIDTLPTNEKSDDLSKDLNQLRDSLDDKNKELIELKQELVATKDEYNAVLEDVNAYLEHSDVIAGNIDEMLSALCEKLTLSEEEKDILMKARGISSNFLDVKINALSSTINKFLDNAGDSVDGTTFDKSATSVADSSHISFTQNMDTRLENAIESMHDEYHSFLRGLQDKMNKAAITERTLGTKLMKQQELLSKLTSLFNGSAVDNLTDKLSLVDFNESKGATIISPTQTRPSDYLENTNDQSDFQDSLQETLKETEKPLENESTAHPDAMNIGSLDTSLHQSNNEESVWVLRNKELAADLSASRLECEQLSRKVKELEANLLALHEDSEKTIADLEKTLQRAVRKSGLYVGENREMQEHIYKIENELEIALGSNHQLQSTSEEIMTECTEYKSQFHKLRSHLLLHLNKVFDVFDKILQRHSIEQAKKKLETLETLDSKNYFKATHVKLESLYIFIETAINSVVEEHAKILMKEKEKRTSRGLSKAVDDGYGSQLHVELLERKWVAERERRKLDADAAEYRIAQLENENKVLREQLRSSLVQYY